MPMAGASWTIAASPVMQDPKAGALSALTWLVDAVQTHKIMSAGASADG